MVYIHKEINAHKEDVESGKAKYYLGELDMMNNSILANVPGPKGTPYEGGYFLFQCYFPRDYPYLGIKITAIDPLPHPCISTTQIGLDVMEKRCFKVLSTLLEVLDNIVRLLEMPEMGKAVNRTALELFLKDREQFNEEVRAAVRKQREKK